MKVLEEWEIHETAPEPLCDLEMIKAMGYCHGIENYSRHFTGRLPGEPPLYPGLFTVQNVGIVGKVSRDDGRTIATR